MRASDPIRYRLAATATTAPVTRYTTPVVKVLRISKVHGRGDRRPSARSDSNTAKRHNGFGVLGKRRLPFADVRSQRFRQRIKITMTSTRAFSVVLAAFLTSAATLTQSVSQSLSPELRSRGEEIYKSACATCHDNPQGRTPGRNAIAITRSPDYLLRVLNDGVMRVQASALSADDKVALVAYLVNAMPGSGSDIDLNANRCTNPPRPLALNGPSWSSWGGNGTVNVRHHPGGGITASNVARLKLNWAFAFPGGASSPPTVAGSRLFLPSMGGVVFSLDARTGCTHWAIDVGTPARTPIAIGKAGNALAAFFGDNKGRVHAVDAETGKELWTAHVETHPMTRLTGAPGSF